MIQCRQLRHSAGLLASVEIWMELIVRVNFPYLVVSYEGAPNGSLVNELGGGSKSTPRFNSLSRWRRCSISRRTQAFLFLRYIYIYHDDVSGDVGGSWSVLDYVRMFFLKPGLIFAPVDSAPHTGGFLVQDDIPPKKSGLIPSYQTAGLRRLPFKTLFSRNLGHFQLCGSGYWPSPEERWDSNIVHHFVSASEKWRTLLCSLVLLYRWTNILFPPSSFCTSISFLKTFSFLQKIPQSSPLSSTRGMGRGESRGEAFPQSLSNC
ncbi:hypothetical protein B0H19DRAFT_1100353 [Mycena capillaripes]|nr:hypothetical protein B0H19DRAFT_1100353 [Mycena capillaripes]